MLVLVNIGHISNTKTKKCLSILAYILYLQKFYWKKRIFRFILFKIHFQINLIQYLFSVPHVRIQGSPDLHVDRGSTINLTCVISHSPEPPAYIFWYLNDEVMAYDSPRYKLSIPKIVTYCTKFNGMLDTSSHSWKLKRGKT